MIHKYFLLYLLFVSSNLTCFTNRDLTAKKVKDKQLEFEGFVLFDVKTVIDVDGSGSVLKALSGNDSLMLSSSRKMYLKNYHLIDIISRINFTDGAYLKKDTFSYDF